MKFLKPIPLVLEDQNGKVLRSFRWDEPEMHLLRVTKTGRLEAHHELNGLKEDGIDYSLLKSVSIETIGSRAIAVSDFAYLRRVSENEKLTIVPNEKVKSSEEEEFHQTLRYSVYAHLLLLLIGLSIFWGKKLFFEKEEVTVKIELPKIQKINVEKKVKTVAQPVQKKINRKYKVAPKAVKAPRSNRVAKRTAVKPVPQKNVNQMGALGALGGFSGGKKGAKGLKLNSALSGPGSGDSMGTKSLGHATAAFAGKGIVSNSGGGGATNIGQVGYGTKGRSGGQAGYGQLNIGGSGDGGGYEHPMQGGGAVEGGLEMSQIEAVIQQNIGQIYYCYEKGLQAQPGLNGRVFSEFVINGSGRVQVAQVGRSSLNSASVEKCMMSKIKGWKFPKPHGNVDVNVSYPFTLKRARHG